MGDDRSSVLIVAVAEYADSRKNRPAVATAAKDFGALFDGSSHATVHAALVGGPTGEQIQRSLRGLGWCRDRPAVVDRALRAGRDQAAVAGVWPP